jgi:hypothetical protein
MCCRGRIPPPVLPTLQGHFREPEESDGRSYAHSTSCPAPVGPLASRAAHARQGFFALFLSSGGDLLAELALGFMTDSLQRLPGLIVLILAAIGMRGNIFGALGSRLGTGMHSGGSTGPAVGSCYKPAIASWR